MIKREFVRPAIIAIALLLPFVVAATLALNISGGLYLNSRNLNLAKDSDGTKPYYFMRGENPDFRPSISYIDDSLLRKDKSQVPNISSPRVHWTSGIYFLSVEKFEEAVTSFSELVRLTPNSSLGHFYLGLAYEHLGDREKAIQEWQSGGASGFFLRRGEFFLRQQELERAENHLNLVVAIEPYQPTGYYILGDLYEERNAEKAVPYYEKAVAFDTTPSMKRQVTIAKIHRLNKCWDLALVAYQNAHDMYPTEMLPIFWMGWTYWFGYQDAGKAISELNKVLLLAPKHLGTHILLGNVLRETGDLNESAYWYSKALQIEPQNEDALRGLGQIALNKGNNKEAILYFSKALAINPRSAYTYVNHFMLGSAFYKENLYEEAIKELEQAIFFSPKYVPAFLMMGDVYYSQNNISNATQYYRLALEIESGNGEALQRLIDVNPIK